MKKFVEIRKGDTIFSYSECEDLLLKDIVRSITKTPTHVYLNHALLEKGESLGEYGQMTEEGYRVFYATDKNLLTPLVRNNIQNKIEELEEMVNNANKKISEYKKKLEELL